MAENMAGSNKTVLVTGGAGFIGSHLVAALLSRGDTVYSLDNYSFGSKENHHDGATYIEGETNDIGSLVTVTPDAVFHLGEYSRVEQSFDDIETVLRGNSSGTHAVLEFVRSCGAKLVYAGSSTKFADGGMGRDQSPYAWTKASNTELVRNYGTWFGIPYAITYFYNVYGPGEREDATTGTVIGIFKRQYEAKEPITVRLPGTQRRNFTHVLDVVDGLVRIGDSGEGDEYGLGHETSYSIMEVAKLFGSEVVTLPERPGNRMDAVLDARRAQKELGWRATRNLEDYIKSITTT